jgi:hypothetical protein
MPSRPRGRHDAIGGAGAGVTPDVARERLRLLLWRAEIRHARHLASLRRGRPPRRAKSLPGWWPPAPAPPPTPAQRPEGRE